MNEAATNEVNGSSEKFDLSALPLVEAKVKFFSPERHFGFVTILDDKGEIQDPPFDAFISSKVLIKANYNPEKMAEGQTLKVKWSKNDKGFAVIFVKRPPSYIPPQQLANNNIAAPMPASQEFVNAT